MPAEPTNLPVSLLPNSRRKTRTLSIVVPLFNEEEVIARCYWRLSMVADNLPEKIEFIFVDDGSTDSSLNVLQALGREDKRIKILALSRNFGKEAASTAGLQAASGDALIIIDADLQDPPELIPAMITRWQEGFDVVLMRRKTRAGESWLKRCSAHCFYRLLNHLSEVEIPPDIGDFRLLSRKAIDAINELPERSRYMKGLFAWVGFRSSIIDYNRHERVAGTSKWNYFALYRLAIDGITSFSAVPLRWVTGVGIVTSLAGLMFGLWVMIKTLVFGEAVDGYPTLVALMTTLGGVQLFFMGVLGEYVGKIFMESKQRPLFIVDHFNAANPPVEKQRPETFAKWEGQA